MMKSEHIKSILDSYVPAYSAEFRFDVDNHLLLTRSAQRVMEMSSPFSTLDLGIGHGHTAKLFDEYYKQYTVVEGSQQIIDDFLKQNPTFKGKIIHDLFETFESSEQFDNIIMTFILEHVEEPRDLLIQYKKFLKPGGDIYIAVPNYAALNKRIALEAGLITDMNVLSDADKQLGHLRLFSVPSLTELVESAGYRIECIEGVFLKPLTTQQLKTLDLSMDILEAMGRLGQNYPELSVGILLKAKNA